MLRRYHHAPPTVSDDQRLASIEMLGAPRTSDWTGSDVVQRIPAWAWRLGSVMAILLVVSAGSSPARAAAEIEAAPPVPAQHTPTASPVLLFVHGINLSFNDVGFDPLVDPLVTEFGGARVQFFEYFQDLGWKVPTETGCQPSAIPVPSPEASNGGMPVDFSGSEDDVCDSMSDLALNAVALDAKVRDINSQAGSPKVVLVSHSMGTAIVRGFLGYSVEVGDGAAETMVDSLISIEGAQDGSYLAPIAAAGLPVYMFLNDMSGLASRPAALGLTPGNAWYNWANTDAARLPDLPTFNVFGDIAYVRLVCILWFDCTRDPRVEIGDTWILPGTDSPFDAPPEGGARFLPGGLNDGQNWQWPVGGPDHEWRPGSQWDEPPIRWMEENPASHRLLRVGDNITLVWVRDCLSQQETQLQEQLYSVIKGRMDGEPYPCHVVGGG